MKPVTRFLPVLIAFVIVSGLSNCSKDSQADFSKSSETNLYNGDATSSGRNTLNSGDAYYRVTLNSTVVSSVPSLCGAANSKNFIKNSITHGSIVVGNDATDYYITVSGNSGWMLKEVKLFAGEEQLTEARGIGTVVHDAVIPSTTGHHLAIETIRHTFHIGSMAG